jgi:ABC-type transport system involved in multi-copper enzyme maturation permease subunit
MTSRPPTSWKRFLPISIPLWNRIWKDYWFTTLICTLTLFLFHWLVVTFLPLYDLRYRLIHIRRMPQILKAMIGPDLMEIVSTTCIGSFAFLHPISLAVLMAIAIMIPSWVLVGQIDRGTIELILSTPTSRRKLLFTTIWAGLFGGVILIAFMLIGVWVGVSTTKLNEPYHFDLIVRVAINLFALYILFLSISIFFSSIFSIRGLATGWVVAFAVFTYLLHFLSEWWEFFSRISFLGPLYYFRPIKIAAGVYDPTRDIVVLLVVSIALLTLSTVWFSRRNIAVV